jgi:hypothetical protein
MGVDYSTLKVHAVYTSATGTLSPSMPFRAGRGCPMDATWPGHVWQPWNGVTPRRDGGPNYIGNTMLPANPPLAPRPASVEPAAADLAWVSAAPAFPWKPAPIDLSTRTTGTQTDLVLGVGDLRPFFVATPEPLAPRMLQTNRALERRAERHRYHRHSERPYDAALRPQHAVRPRVTNAATANDAAGLRQPPLNPTLPYVAPQAGVSAQGLTPLSHLEAMYPALSPQVARDYPARWFS